MIKTVILIVEDEAIVAADLAAKLRQLGYEIAGIAARGEEAVALAIRLRPHLVLMDIRLNGSIDGIEAAEAIRREYDTPVVYLTAHSDGATLARAKLTGPFGYIFKPFEERELATQIELALYKHQADRQIRQQREWLRVTLVSIGDAVIATDASGCINFLNPVAESLTGWKAEEAAGQSVSSVFRMVNEETGQPLEEPVARVLREGYAIALANHAALVTRDGRIVPVEDSAAPILDAGGRVIGAVLVFHDVTEKRRAEEALRKSRDELELRVQERTAELAETSRLVEAFFNHTITPMAFLDKNFDYIRVNKAYARAGERSPDDHIGQNHFELYPSDAKVVFQKVLRTKQPYYANARPFVYPKNPERGVTYWDWILVPILDNTGEVEFLVFSLNDVTERKRAEDNLRQSEENYRGIFENAPIGIFQSTPEGGLLNANPALARMLGYESPSELLKSITEIGSQLFVKPSRRQGIVEAVLSSRDPRTFENSYYRKDGSTIPTYLTMWASRGPSGAIRYLEGYVEDITDRKKAEDEIRLHMKRLEASNQALQHFTSIASHDMQEPLRKVISFGKMLMQRHADSLDDEGKDFLDRMLNATDRMQTLLKSLLDYSRVTTSAEPFKQVELGTIVREVLSDLEVRTQKTGTEVHVGELPTIEADPIQMRQLFQNLIGNALKFHKEGEKPLIEVRGTSSENGTTEIIVADNGIGFDEKYLGKIFAPFQRLHGRGEYDGTGMGLAICKKIVERHGGSITARSSPGHGSIFTVTLHETTREKPRHV